MAKKLSEIYPEGTLENPIKVEKEDVFDKTVEIVRVSFTEGDKGTYAKIVFTGLTDTGFNILVTGAQDVVTKLQAVTESNQLPIEATFVKAGNAIFLK